QTWGTRLRSFRATSCAETVRSPPKPRRYGEDTVQPTNAEGRRRKPWWDKTAGRRFESCRGRSAGKPQAAGRSRRANADLDDRGDLIQPVRRKPPDAANEPPPRHA